MVKSEHKRQQKLARKQAKDRKRHQQEVQKRQQVASLHGQMLQSAAGSIVYCGVSEGEQGMMTVVFARRAPNGLNAIMCLLLDTYCLGVKNSTAGLGNADRLRDIIGRANTSPCEPALARGLVESAIEFANKAGLQPHGDYRHAQPLWGNVERGSIEGQYEMGMDGKHTYINGPFDDQAKQRMIQNKLETNLGEGNYQIIMMMGDVGRDFDFGEDVDFDDVQDFDDAQDNVQYRRIDLGSNNS